VANLNDDSDDSANTRRDFSLELLVTDPAHTRAGCQAEARAITHPENNEALVEPKCVAKHEPYDKSARTLAAAQCWVQNSCLLIDKANVMPSENNAQLFS